MTTARGQYAKTPQRRREIVAAGAAVFSEQGFRDGTLRDIADRVGLTHAGLRHHFPTKVRLLEAVLHAREEESMGRAPTRPGIDSIRAWITEVGGNTSRPVLMEIEAVLGAEALAPDHPAHAYFDTFYARAESILLRSFTILDERGGLRTGVTPAAAAQIVLAQTLGLQSMWLRNRSIDIRARLTDCVQGLLTIDLEPVNDEVHSNT